MKPGFERTSRKGRRSRRWYRHRDPCWYHHPGSVPPVPRVSAAWPPQGVLGLPCWHKTLRERTQSTQKRVVPMHPRAAIANHALGVDEVDRPADRPVVLTRTVERGDLRPRIVEERKRQTQL